MMKLLCTDLDRTLLPNGAEPESPLARPLLWHLLGTQGMALAYVSGRDLGRVLQAIDDYDLQRPDAIVADVGTSIYVPGRDGWDLHERWHALIARDWNGLDSAGIGDSVRAVVQLEEQEADRQTRYKRSYYLPRDHDIDTLATRLREHFDSVNVRASLIFSDDPEKGVQLLDILPVHATKFEAVLHIQGMLGVEDHECLFSGDSGNDVTALASHLLSVTVANADADTRNAVRKLARSNGTEDRSYQAEGGLTLAESRLLNGNYAAGIVEGLVHYNPEWHRFLLDPKWVDSAIERHAATRHTQSRLA